MLEQETNKQENQEQIEMFSFQDHPVTTILEALINVDPGMINRIGIENFTKAKKLGIVR